jgi:hypothetical protein
MSTRLNPQIQRQIVATDDTAGRMHQGVVANGRAFWV